MPCLRWQCTELWSTNGAWHKQQNQSPRLLTVRYGFDEIIMDISFPFSRTCLPLLGFPFGITLPLLLLLHNDPFLLEAPSPPLKLRLVTVPTTGSICSYSHVIFQGDLQIISWQFLSSCFCIVCTWTKRPGVFQMQDFGAEIKWLSV